MYVIIQAGFLERAREEFAPHGRSLSPPPLGNPENKSLRRTPPPNLLVGAPSLDRERNNDVYTRDRTCIYIVCVSVWIKGVSCLCFLLEKLVSELPTLVPELVSLVKTGKNDEVRGHALSALVTMVTHHREAIKECQKEEVGLQSILVELSQSLSAEDYEVHDMLRKATEGDATHNTAQLARNINISMSALIGYCGSSAGQSISLHVHVCVGRVG